MDRLTYYVERPTDAFADDLLAYGLARSSRRYALYTRLPED